MSGYSEDIAAINDYMHRTLAQNVKAYDLQLQWIKWHDNLSWWEKNTDSDIWNEARKRRDNFNIANETPPDPEGLTSEDLGTGEGSGVNIVGDTLHTAANVAKGGAILGSLAIIGGIIVTGIVAIKVVPILLKQYIETKIGK